MNVERIVGIDMLGERVRCPYCGDYGVVKVKKVKSRDKNYEYLAIYHRGEGIVLFVGYLGTRRASITPVAM